ncbi:hypothetical protein EBN88_12325 [Streptomyces triticirhizae]|uniref:HTH luxR-type domain-containing protein n=2 Tax=Streptomyces triticirhizae TaxID=2483353 RepID=A0A3M2LUC1_9ACTN|nr:hypothetical protein EBN88_12325 [Streptomyces triticirhizae]
MGWAGDGATRDDTAPGRRGGGWLQEADRSDSSNRRAVSLLVAALFGRGPEFWPSYEEVRHGARLCEILGNHLPAIELVATQIMPSRLRETHEELLALANAVGRRSRGDRGGKSRTDPMNLALDWCYSKLSHRERTVMSRIAVLGTEFDPEAVVAVCVDRNLSDESVLDALNMLEHRALIRRRQSDSEKIYFRQSEAAVAYGIERLRENQDYFPAHRALVAWLWSRAERLTHVCMLSRAENEWFAVRVNYLAIAVEFTWNHTRDDHRHDILAALLASLWLHTDRQHEGRQLIQRALTRDARSPYRSDLLVHGLWFSEVDDNPQRILQTMYEAVQSAREARQDSSMVRALNSLANAYAAVHDYEAAQRYFVESMDLARRLDDEFSLAVCSHMYAMFLVGLGKFQEAADAVSVTTERFEAEANPFQRASYRYVLGAIELASGRIDAAESFMVSSLGIFVANDPSICYPIEGLALVAAARGQARRCVALLAATAQLRDTGRASTRVPEWWSRNLDEARAASLAQLDEADAWDTEERARGLTPQQLIDYAVERGDRSLVPEPTALTYREHEVAVQVAKGLSNRQISAYLHIAESTVSSHIKRIYAKLGIRSRTQLAAWIAAHTKAS